jgi:hypothetical protein
VGGVLLDFYDALHHDECEDTIQLRILYFCKDFSLPPQCICASDQTRLWHNQLEFTRGNHQPARNALVLQWTAAVWTGLHISSTSSPLSSSSLSAAPASSLRTALATCEGAREDHCQVATADLARHHNRRLQPSQPSQPIIAPSQPSQPSHSILVS